MRIWYCEKCNVLTEPLDELRRCDDVAFNIGWYREFNLQIAFATKYNNYVLIGLTGGFIHESNQLSQGGRNWLPIKHNSRTTYVLRPTILNPLGDNAHPSPKWVSKRYALPFFFRFASEARNISALKHPIDWIGRKIAKTSSSSRRRYRSSVDVPPNSPDDRMCT